MNNSHQQVLDARRAIIGRIEAKARFQERFAAAEGSRRRIGVAPVPAIRLGDPQDVVYYDGLSFVTGYGSAYFDGRILVARFDDQGKPVAQRRKVGANQDLIESPEGTPIATVTAIAQEPSVVVHSKDGSYAGTASIVNGQTAIVRNERGDVVARGLFGPDRVVWLDRVGNTIAWAKSRVFSGAWLSTEDAWPLVLGAASV